MLLIFKCNIEKVAAAAILFRFLCSSWKIEGVPKLSKLLLKKFKSGSKDLSIKILAVLSKGLNFTDSKFRTLNS